MHYILFDLECTQPNSSGKRHGAGIYGEIVLKRMLELKIPIICYYNGNKWLNPEVQKLLDGEKVELIDITRISIDEIVKEKNIEVLYSAYPSLREYKVTKCKVVVTLHGLRSLETPFDFNFFRYKNNNLRKKVMYAYRKIFNSKVLAKKIKFYEELITNSNFKFVTVSNHSAASFKAYIPSFIDREIPVFYSPSTSGPDLEKHLFPDNYFLLVSGNRWEKNSVRAILALDELFSEGALDKFRVRVTGTNEQPAYNLKLKNSDRFQFMGYVDDFELNQLFYDAYCLIYPSLNEGFGYPPLEAMHHHTPVIASPFASISEVCGDAVLYFNPFDKFEIKNRILQVLEKKIYSSLVKKGDERYEFITKKQKDDLDALIKCICE